MAKREEKYMDPDLREEIKAKKHGRCARAGRPRSYVRRDG